MKFDKPADTTDATGFPLRIVYVSSVFEGREHYTLTHGLTDE